MPPAVDVAEDPAEDEDASDPPAEASPEEPFAGYPYTGEACGKDDCGVEKIPKGWECATFTTESGKSVIGCQNPETYEEKGCNRIRFFSLNSKPIYPMDTCSGGMQYAPKDPPGGFVNWYDPLTSGIAENEKECRAPQCGLVGEVPPYYECARMLDTVDGDVRGCWNPYQYNYDGSCPKNVRLYDDEGTYLGTRSSCFDWGRYQECGKGQCGVPKRVPDDWRCVRQGALTSELDGEIIPPLVVCHNPTWENAGYRDPKPEGICMLFFDENNRPYAVYEECGRGGQQVGDGATSAAQDAFDALGHDGQGGTGDEPDDAAAGAETNGGPPGLADSGPGEGLTGDATTVPPATDASTFGSPQDGPGGATSSGADEPDASPIAAGGPFSGRPPGGTAGGSDGQTRAAVSEPPGLSGYTTGIGSAGSPTWAEPTDRFEPSNAESAQAGGPHPTGGATLMYDPGTRFTFLVVGGVAKIAHPSDSHSPARAEGIATLGVGAGTRDRAVQVAREMEDARAEDAEVGIAAPGTESPTGASAGEDVRSFAGGLVSDAAGRVGAVRNVFGGGGYLGAGVLLTAGLVAAGALRARRSGPIRGVPGEYGRLPGRRPR